MIVPVVWGSDRCTLCRLAVIPVAAVFLMVFMCVTPASASRFSVSIQASPKLLASPIAGTAIYDTTSLLQQAMPSAAVGINKGGAQVVIILPDIHIPTNSPNPAMAASTSHRLPTPDRSYRWKSRHEAGHTALRLQARSPEGVACGLYGLLQGKLGFRFHHSRESLIPE
jgi:hypothetical protein